MRIRNPPSPFSNRFHLDFNQCQLARGFSQIRRESDSSDRGTWANPWTGDFVRYHHGDVAYKRFNYERRALAEVIRRIPDLICVDAGHDIGALREWRRMGINPTNYRIAIE